MGEILTGESIEVLGIIIPANWDSHGGVTDIAISAFDESEYLIEKTEKSIRLVSFLHRQVKIRGRLLQGVGTDRPVIRVEEFSLTKTSNSKKTEIQ